MANKASGLRGLFWHSRIFCLGFLYITTFFLNPEVAKGQTRYLDEPSNLDNTINIDDSSNDLDQKMPQVTSVSELRDVSPTDWAFEALQSLVERYGCIVGYPDATFRGKKALSRWEFAAGLSACMTTIERLIQSNQEVLSEDLEKIRKLTSDFQTELVALQGKIDKLEARTTFLEDKQFSTTTKLRGFVGFNITGATAGDNFKVETANINAPLNIRPAGRDFNNRPLVTEAKDPQITMSYLAWLSLETSFTGKDLLVTQLASANGNSPANAFSSAGLYNTFGVPYIDQTGGPSGNNEVVIRELFYQFPVGESFQIAVGPRINWYRYFDQNRFTFFINGASSYNSGGSTLLNSIDRGSGAVVQWNISEQFQLNIAYIGENNEYLPSEFGFNSSSDPDKGLFNASYTATVQLSYAPTKNVNIRLLYNYGKNDNNVAIYDENGNITGFGVGGATGEPIYGVADDGFGGSINPAAYHAINLSFDWLITGKFGVFGRYTYTTTDIDPRTAGRSGGSIDAQTFQVGVAFPDLGKEGSLGTISFVMPFDVLSGEKYLASGAGNGGTQYDLEFNYYYPISDNIAIVPAFYMIFNANNFDSNPTVFVGNVRAQFSF